MVFIKLKYFFIFSTFITSATLFANESGELPELKAKQELNNILFITDDGRFTYYQRRSGTLLLSTNYSIEELISSSPGTHYKVYGNPRTNNLVIEVTEDLHSNLNLRRPNDIYKTTRGRTRVEKVGQGQNARLHRDGEWISYFSPQDRRIIFQNFETPVLRFNVELINRLNPYFQPQTLMSSDSTILYTDIGARGTQAVIKHNRSENETNILLQTASANQHLNICLLRDYLVIQEIGVRKSQNGSMIHKIPRNNLSIDRSETIYQSRYNDLGSLLCDKNKNEIYFIKNTRELSGRRTSEVAKINGANEMSIITSLNFVTQLIQMDKSILIPFRENVYVLKGQSDYTTQDILLRSLENEG